MTDRTFTATELREVLDGNGTAADKVHALHELILFPSRPTLADMTLDEQAECTGMQADLVQGDRVVILDGIPEHDDRVQVLESSLDVYRPVSVDVTPRPDLPRLEWPGDTSEPALPEGWRLADHPNYGRVIVTSPAPDADGDVWFIHRDDYFRRKHDSDWCKQDALTYIDGPDAPPADEPDPEAFPGVAVGKPITDPLVMLGLSRSAPDGTVVEGSRADCHPLATTKSGGSWQTVAGMRHHLYQALDADGYRSLESVTVLRWGDDQEADQ